MGDEQRGHPGLGQDLAHLLAQPIAQSRVEVRERLVEQDEIRGGGERPGEGDALLLAARQLVYGPARVAGEPDQLEHLGDAAAIGLAAEPVADVAGHVEVWEQRVVLEHHPDPAALGGDEHARRR